MDDMTIALAKRSRDLHGVGMDGKCLHCLASWPCMFRAQAEFVVETLSPRQREPTLRRQPLRPPWG
jgi:hypothetical protein